MWCIFKNCGIPKYPSQLLKLSPKSHFIFSDFLCQGQWGAYMIIYWNKINSFNHKHLYNPSYSQATLFLVTDIFPGEIYDISYSIFLKGYISNTNSKKFMKWVCNWQMKWQCFFLMSNTSLSLYLMTCKTAKVNNLEIALWAFKNVQNITGSTKKTFQHKNQHKPSCKSEFPFCCCCCCWHYLHRIFSFSISF